MSTCSENKSPKDIYGFLVYEDPPGVRHAGPLAPTYVDPNPYNVFPRMDDDCLDEPMDSLRPFVEKNFSVNPGPHVMNTLIDLTQKTTAERFYRWTLDGTTMRTWWKTPTLWKIWNPKQITKLVWDVPIDGVIETPNANEWIYLFINNTHTADHPIHLHGHDFYILAQGLQDTMHNFTLTTQNPPRRDTALLPAAGYLVIGWITDNPGVWLMHCHIGWHTEEGFALQFIERQSDIRGVITDEVDNLCQQWQALNETQDQYDSGF